MGVLDDIRRAIEKAPRHPVHTAANQAAAVADVVAEWLNEEARVQEGIVAHPDCEPDWDPQLRFSAKTLRWLAGKLKPSLTKPLPETLVSRIESPPAGTPGEGGE